MLAGQCFGLVFHLKYNVSQGCYLEGCSLEGCYKDRCVQRSERFANPSCPVCCPGMGSAAATTEVNAGELIRGLIQGQGPSQEQGLSQGQGPGQEQSDPDNRFHDCIRRNVSGQVSLEEIFFGGITFQGGMSDQVGQVE